MADAMAPDGSSEIVDSEWQAVLDKLEDDNPEVYKLAVLEADKIFDDLLKRKKIPGSDMGERLKQLRPEQLANLDDVWRAHKIRNRVAHESGFHLTRAQAKMAVEIFEKAIKGL